MNKKLVGVVVVVAVFAVPLAVKFGSSKQVREAELAKVEQKLIKPSILASGTLVFRQEVQLSSEVIGKVSEVLVKEGDKISAGQVLLRLDPTAYKAEVAQQEANRRSAEIAIERAQINLTNQQHNLERSAQLVKDKFIDASKHEAAVYQVDLAKVELRSSRESLLQASALLSQAQQRLAKTEVRAPISGTATAVQIKIGETAVASATGIAGSSLMTIADVGTIMAEVNVDEADVARVQSGQSARVFPSAFADKPVAGKVESVSMAPKLAAAGSQGRSYIVKLRLDDSKLALRTGMTCRVEITVDGGSAKPVVPIQAVLAEETGPKDSGKGGNYVYAVVDGKAKKTAVELGMSDDANQEVTKGLAVGDSVAIGPARLLRELRDGEALKALKAEIKPGKLAVEAKP